MKRWIHAAIEVKKEWTADEIDSLLKSESKSRFYELSAEWRDLANRMEEDPELCALAVDRYFDVFPDESFRASSDILNALLMTVLDNPNTSSEVLARLARDHYAARRGSREIALHPNVTPRILQLMIYSGGYMVWVATSRAVNDHIAEQVLDSENVRAITELSIAHPEYIEDTLEVLRSMDLVKAKLPKYDLVRFADKCPKYKEEIEDLMSAYN